MANVGLGITKCLLLKKSTNPTLSLSVNIVRISGLGSSIVFAFVAISTISSWYAIPSSEEKEVIALEFSISKKK